MVNVDDQGLLHEMRKRECVRLRTVGYHPKDIGSRMDVYGGGAVTYGEVKKLLREAAEDARVEAAGLVNEAKMLAQERCEWLWSLCARCMVLAAEGECPSDKLIAAAIKILERQARLLGLDEKPVNASPQAEWAALAGMPMETVLRQAKSLGLSVEPFAT